jgi:hypothetical protein
MGEYITNTGPKNDIRMINSGSISKVMDTLVMFNGYTMTVFKIKVIK